MTNKIAILGAGAWGTALAVQAARTGADVMLWSRKPEIVHSINAHSKNPLHLSHLILPNRIRATGDIEDVLSYEHILLAVPTHSIRHVLGSAGFKERHSFIICSKGLEVDSLKMMSEVVQDIAPQSDIAILSGPNFAYEVAEGLPAVTSIASQDPKYLSAVTEIFATPNFVIYKSDDVIGIQICGAVKNVIAIACGICIGGDLGENAKAAILTQGLREASLLIGKLGGKTETILSPAGIGDFSLTCGSRTSRNMLYGCELATGKVTSGKLAEGISATSSIDALANKYDLELPLLQATKRALEDPSNATEYISNLFI